MVFTDRHKLCVPPAVTKVLWQEALQNQVGGMPPYPMPYLTS